MPFWSRLRITVFIITIHAIYIYIYIILVDIDNFVSASAVFTYLLTEFIMLFFCIQAVEHPSISLLLPLSTMGTVSYVIVIVIIILDQTCDIVTDSYETSTIPILLKK